MNTQAAYDDQNIFAKILRGEIPNNTIYEDDHVLAFADIAPQAPVHILVIPKGAYSNITDFSTRATTKEITAFYAAIDMITRQENIAESGFRVIANTGIDGGQEVPHFHLHILGGAPIGAITTKEHL